MIQGLLPLSDKDKQANKPYHAGALFTLGAIPQNSYMMPYAVIGYEIFHQRLSDECGGCALATISGAQEGIALDPHFHWMMARQRAGMKLHEFGVNNRDLAMTSVKVGSLEKHDVAFTFDDRDKVANPTSWDIAGMLKKSVLHKKGSVVWVENFDELKRSITRLNELYKKPHGAVFGLTWAYPLEQATIMEVSETGFGHDVAVVGWEGDYVRVVNSYGNEAGVGGTHMLHKNIFNRWASEYGCFIPIDATQEEIKWAVENGVRLDQSWIVNLLIVFANALKDLLAKVRGV